MNLDRTMARLSRGEAGGVDLAEVALHLARDEYADLAVADYLAEIDDLADRLRPRLIGTIAHRVETLVKLLFEKEHFRGDQVDYYCPDNSYLNRVIDRRLGLPLTLSLLAVAVGRRAGMKIDGVALPGHYIARASLDGRFVLFDPYNGGRRLRRADCEQLVEKAIGEAYTASNEDLRPAPAAATLRRMLANLKGVYLRKGEFVRATRVIGRILQIDPGNPVECRDLGACLLRAGRPGAAIDPLRKYLATMPEAADADVVRTLVKRAEAELARWN